MDPFSGVPSTEPASGAGLPRRALLKGAVAAGLAAGSVPVTAAVAGAKPQSPVTDWSTFDRLVQAAFDRFRLVGAAVAVVSADQVLHTATFGYRSLQPRRRVTPTTRFRVGSTSKSMTAALIATHVDQKKFGWDQPVIDVWPGFRAPTDQLTKTLRVRDLLGMDSGLGEPPATSELHLGDWTPLQLTQGIVNLPVLGPPGDDVLLQQQRQRRRRIPAVPRGRRQVQRATGRLFERDAGPDPRASRDVGRDDRRRPPRHRRRLCGRLRAGPARQGVRAALRTVGRRDAGGWHLGARG
jgi:CubicO group peptidase (beta-lactamase class C family)